MLDLATAVILALRLAQVGAHAFPRGLLGHTVEREIHAVPGTIGPWSVPDAAMPGPPVQSEIPFIHIQIAAIAFEVNLIVLQGLHKAGLHLGFNAVRACLPFSLAGSAAIGQRLLATLDATLPVCAGRRLKAVIHLISRRGATDEQRNKDRAEDGIGHDPKRSCERVSWWEGTLQIKHRKNNSDCRLAHITEHIRGNPARRSCSGNELPEASCTPPRLPRERLSMPACAAKPQTWSDRHESCA